MGRMAIYGYHLFLNIEVKKVSLLFAFVQCHINKSLLLGTVEVKCCTKVGII